MNIWLKVCVSGAAAVAVALVLLVAGFAVKDSSTLLYLSIVISIVAVPLFLIGLVGSIVTFATRKRSAT